MLLGRRVALARLELAGDDLSADAARALARGLEAVPRLSVLSLDACSIGADGAEALFATGVPHVAGTLKELYLSENGMGPGSAAQLVAAMKGGARGVTNLGLQGNALGDAGAAALAKGFKHANGLTFLFLCNNSIADAGAAALAKAMRGAAGLKFFFASNNRVGDAGAAALADALGALPAVETLNLYANEIGDAGGAALAEAIGKLRTLKKVDVRANKMGDAGRGAVQKACAKVGAKCKV